MTQPLLFNVLFAWKCSSTHHKLAMDALRQLRAPQAETWRNMFLGHIETYLDGAKAPDNKFKDFKNHVLHVHEGEWGGAIKATEQWYEKTRTALAAKQWAEAVYNAGVLSHYYSDPWQPFHTGQTEQEGIVHRAAEWSIACAYNELQELLETELGGYPEVPMPTGNDWLAEMVRYGAHTSNPHYQFSIDHYDLKSGTKNPPTGLDAELKRRIAKLIGGAVSGFARILDRLIAEADVTPPHTNVTLLGVMAQLTVPIFFVTKKMKNAKEKAAVLAMYNEFQQTGKVLKTLPEDDWEIRRMHAEEVSKTPLQQLDKEIPPPPGQAFIPPVAKQPPVAAPKPTASSPPAVEQPVAKSKPAQPVAPSVPPETKPAVVKPAVAETPAVTVKPQEPKSLRLYLDRKDPIEKAPSIGPKTAGQLENVGVKLVSDLLDRPAETIAAALKIRHFDATLIKGWQHQAQLMCTVPGLRGYEAQLLVACSITSRSDLAAAQPPDLTRTVAAFAQTPSGQRVLRDSAIPDEAEVTSWITAAQSDPGQRAAA